MIAGRETSNPSAAAMPAPPNVPRLPRLIAAAVAYRNCFMVLPSFVCSDCDLSWRLERVPLPLTIFRRLLLRSVPASMSRLCGAGGARSSVRTRICAGGSRRSEGLGRTSVPGGVYARFPLMFLRRVVSAILAGHLRAGPPRWSTWAPRYRRSGCAGITPRLNHSGRHRRSISTSTNRGQPVGR
jgi:hypothetical protein